MDNADRVQKSVDLDKIKAERQVVYGDPRENHRGIAQMWACLLQPHADKIARMEPIPDWAVALMMGALKLNRSRRVYKEDNYDDLAVYVLEFAKQWQMEDESGKSATIPDNPNNEQFVYKSEFLTNGVRKTRAAPLLTWNKSKNTIYSPSLRKWFGGFTLTTGEVRWSETVKVFTENLPDVEYAVKRLKEIGYHVVEVD